MHKLKTGECKLLLQKMYCNIKRVRHTAWNWTFRAESISRKWCSITIKTMINECITWTFIKTKFKRKTSAICCSNGKVNLPPLVESPETLLTYVAGANWEYKHFLKYIQKYNSCIQMTSFRVTNIVKYSKFMFTFKKIDSLFLVPKEDALFLQIYFMDKIEILINETYLV